MVAHEPNLAHLFNGKCPFGSKELLVPNNDSIVTAEADGIILWVLKGPHGGSGTTSLQGALVTAQKRAKP